MATQTAAAPSTKVITGKVRLSYLAVFKATAFEEGKDPKFSASLIIPKSDKETIAKIKRGIDAAIEAGKNIHFSEKEIKGIKFWNPLRDGDEEKPDDEAYKNAYYITAKSGTKPGLVDKDLNPIMDQDEVFSGCYGRASVNFYPFGKGNPLKGIGVGLNNIQKLADGEPLGSGRSKPEDDFDAVETSEDDDFMS